MSVLVNLAGAITVGPPCADGCADGTVLNDAISIGCGACGKSYQNVVVQPSFALNASVFTEIPGIGSGLGVAQGLLLKLESSASIQVRLTFQDPGGGADIVSVITMNGLLILQPSEAGYLKLVELLGTATVSWLIAGN